MVFSTLGPHPPALAVQDSPLPHLSSFFLQSIRKLYIGAMSRMFTMLSVLPLLEPSVEGAGRSEKVNEGFVTSAGRAGVIVC